MVDFFPNFAAPNIENRGFSERNILKVKVYLLGKFLPHQNRKFAISFAVLFYGFLHIP